jgi:hypothetical protein
MSENKPMISECPEFEEIFNSKGGLFDVSNNKQAELMKENIGRTCSVQRPGGNLIEGLTVELIQKDYKGDLCYRVSSEEFQFGFPVEPDWVTFDSLVH